VLPFRAGPTLMRCRMPIAAIALMLGSGLIGAPLADPILGERGVLPPGTEFGEPALLVPRQVLSVERLGSAQSFLVALGNMAFSSPGIMGGLAKRAGISCATCHVSGANNPDFFLPGHSSRPGGVDVTGPAFYPKADDGLFNPLDIPSLFGIRRTAPYGRDGRLAGLREFTRNVILHEFAGPEPDPLVLDALVIYMQQFEFLPNPKLDPLGRLTAAASAAARRGEALFRRPFAGMDGIGCASCHVPSAAFIDQRPHDVGTGAAYDTPTLLGIRFTAPYFHDGRAATLAEVVAHFDEVFGLGLDGGERADLVAYLEAVGDGEEPFVPKDLAFDMAELAIFAGLLEVTLADRDPVLTRLVVDTVNAELREVGERWYRPEDRQIRARIAGWAVQLRRVDSHASEEAWGEAQAALATCRAMIDADLPRVGAAERRSLYQPDVLAVYRDARRRLADASK
jgi:mono/diheme cytochrome c family protein